MRNKTILRICGLAVFKGDKFVGELSSTQTVYHLILSNKLKSTIIDIPSPFNDSDFISLSVSSAKSKNTVDIINSSPFITCDVELDTRVLSSTLSANYMNEENLKQIEELANSYFQSHFEDYAYQTSLHFGADIAGFGRYAVRHFSNLNDWNNYNWLDNYKNSFFQINVHTHISSSYLIVGNKS